MIKLNLIHRRRSPFPKGEGWEKCSVLLHPLSRFTPIYAIFTLALSRFTPIQAIFTPIYPILGLILLQPRQFLLYPTRFLVAFYTTLDFLAKTTFP